MSTDVRLEEVRISNLALMDDVSVDLEPGLNVITGPTGSGKTMVIEALRLALGDRADYDLLADSGDARVEVLADRDADGVRLFDSVDESELQFRRELNQEHSSPAYLNGSRVRLKTLRDNRGRLIDFHGQHDNQAVFESDFARRVLDRFGDYEELLEEYRTRYEKYVDLESELEALQGSDEQLRQRVEFLNYQLSELEEFEPGADEWEEIEDRRLRLESTEEVEETVENALSLLGGEPSLTGRLEELRSNLETLEDVEEDLSDWTEEVRGAGVMLEELRRELREVRESVTGTPGEYDELMNRRSRWLELARKHDVPPEQLYERYRELTEEKENLENREERREELTRKLEELESELYDRADALHARRTENAEQLAERVTETLGRLNLEKAGFEIEVRERDLGVAGYDDVQWLFASHDSQALGPLTSRVSGGEISRVLLAIKSALAEADETAVLVFDEIDAGISGEEANRVGDVLRELARYHQVLCITHLPLVASRADHHLLVRRTDAKDEVTVEAEVLDRDQRVDELSRLLSGDETSDVSREQARELLEESP